ncbi:hypothetical protein [Cognaticolwellia mytili]|uniref:hypothetical protein n=1 Tax=Cognaticolwellia mytili TaxID=1888913 RepID=UPI000A16E5B5|nr:hypothetical protein [Cognaticolwellia mytili]
MTPLQVTEKSERSLGEVVVVVVLVALLMASFIFYFFKHQGQLTRAGFESVSHVFSARINGIRAQWFMDAQPKFVIIEGNFNDKREGKLKVPVNGKGWVDVKNDALRCQLIWQYVMESPLVYIKQPVEAVLVSHQGREVASYCQFSLPSGEYFIYHSDNGKVDFKQ